ncbi:hypothetical protein QP927_08575 [Corynebacterium pseudodiphtheriticum]|uniref:hypothetical protein n=1 Tax=Corynebacterium pseudodiphtheriticum TaxID=37637 RepID=UPI00254B297D|nr:hypothetical protein [Corynebacterium pseudodiphtheriticum]MDK8478918.1 hypothetical protein [Corynebacterium pseudodiphtheriticum]
MLEEIKTQVQSLDDSDFQEFRSWIFLDEVKRREAQPEVEQGQVEMIKELAEAGTIQRPETVSEEEAINGNGVAHRWVDPAGRRDKAYLQGEAVVDDGEIYFNRKTGFNYAKPNSPNSGWERHNPPKQSEEQAEAEPPAPAGAPAWVEPSNKQSLYAQGARVSHKGAEYESLQDDNRDEPGASDKWRAVTDG